MKRKTIFLITALALVLALAAPAAAYYSDYGYYDCYEEDSGNILVPIGVAAGISGLICFGLVSMQKNVHKKSGALEYITEQGVHFTHASDRFTHTTQTRRKLPNNQNGKR